MHRCQLFKCVTVLLLLISYALLYAHVPEGTGATLQFYSYNTSNPPKINACLTDATTAEGNDATLGLDNDEWKDAYIREIIIVSFDGTDTLTGAMFFMNDDDYLYIGVTTDFNNSSNNTYIEFAFDQGANGGDHNDKLDGGGTGVNNGEYSARVYPNKGYAQQKAEFSFDGTQWVQQNNLSEVFTGYGRNFGTSFVQVEYKIPINGNPSPEDGKSYLNVTGTQELGFYISFYAQGGDVFFRWPETNGDINDATTAPGWIDLRLGVDHSFTTFYSTFNANGNPTIDGNIKAGATPDDAWRGCYQRNIVLTNFADSTLNAILYSVEDNANTNFYVGMKITDENNAGDYCRIYQEHDNAVSPSTGRNYLLNSGTENALVADENAFTAADDRYWDGGTETWAQDATNTTQNARGVYYAGGYYEYEFLVDRSAGNDGDDQDIYMADGNKMGFHILYHDANGSGSDYYWEYAPNSDAIEIDPNGNVFTAAGWPGMQLGAPYVQIIFPEDDKEIEGVANIRIYAEDENADGIVSTIFYRKSVPATTYQLTRIDMLNEYSGTWNVIDLPDGPDTLVFEVTDDEGITVQRLVNLTIRNEAGTVVKPVVRVTDPVPGDTLSGPQTITFTKDPGSGTKISNLAILVDGDSTGLDTGATTHQIITNDYLDGAHTIQIQAINDAGMSGISPVATYHFRNAPSVTLTSPSPDAVLTGTAVTVKFQASAIPMATVATCEIFVDGGLVDTAETDSSYLWNTLSLNDGQHTLQVKVTDSKGKTAVSQLISVTVFNTPMVSITAPEDTAEISGIDTIKFTVSYPPGAYRDTTEIAFNGGSWMATTTVSTYTWVTTDFLDGNHIVQVRAIANNGKTGYSQIRNYKVSNEPSASITAPAPGEALNGTYTVQFVITPISSATINKREVSIDGGAWTDSLVDTTTYPMTTVGWEEGTHSIQVRGYDNKGRIGYSNIRMFVVDNAPPILADPKVVYPDNAQSTKVDTTVLVTVLAKDVLVGLATDSAVVLTSEYLISTGTVTYLMHDDGLNGDLVANDNIFSAVLTIKVYTTGPIGYSITAEDALGNSVTVTSVIMLDNTPPVVSPFEWIPDPEVSSLPGDVTYFDKLVLRGTYSDSGGSKLSRVFISVKNDSGNHVNNSPIELSPKDSGYSRIINLVPGTNFIALEARDNAGNKAARHDTITYIEPKATKVVGKNGGTVQSPNGVTVYIPQHALLKSKEITITKVDPIDEPEPLSPDVQLLSVPHEFGPDGLTFRKPITITLSYTDADLDVDQDGVNDFDPTKFTIVFWDGETWLNAGNAKVDQVNRLVTVTVNHFTMFDIAQVETSVSSELIGYWTHNPVKSGTGSNFMYKVPSTGTVSLSIIDLAGDLVCKLIPKGTTAYAGREIPFKWSGANVADRFAGAGLYVYVFTYTDLSGKSTVIRKPIGLLK